MTNPDHEAIIQLLEDSEDWGVWKKCPVKDCTAGPFPNYSALLAHLRRGHSEMFG